MLGSAIGRARSGFYGWRMVALMLGPRSAGNGVYVFGNTLFVIPLEEALGLNRSLSSVMFAVGGVIGGLSAPVSGMLMDRWGPRRVLLWSVVTGAAGYCLFAASPNALFAFIVFLGPISLVMLNIAFNASSGVINNWFNRYKSTAFALMQGGSGLGSLAIISGLALAIDAWGWRQASVLAGAIIVGLGLPTALATRNTPEEMGLHPDGEAPAWGSTSSSPAGLAGPTAGQALRTPSFWMMVATTTLFGGAMSALGIHFVPVMVWKGMTEVEGALMLTMWALGSVVTIVSVGALADRLGEISGGRSGMPVRRRGRAAAEHRRRRACVVAGCRAVVGVEQSVSADVVDTGGAVRPALVLDDSRLRDGCAGRGNARRADNGGRSVRGDRELCDAAVGVERYVGRRRDSDVGDAAQKVRVGRALCRCAISPRRAGEICATVAVP